MQVITCWAAGVSSMQLKSKSSGRSCQMTETQRPHHKCLHPASKAWKPAYLLLCTYCCKAQVPTQPWGFLQAQQGKTIQTGEKPHSAPQEVSWQVISNLGIMRNTGWNQSTVSMLWLRTDLLNTRRKHIRMRYHLHKDSKIKKRKNTGYDALVLLPITEGLI